MSLKLKLRYKVNMPVEPWVNTQNTVKDKNSNKDLLITL